MVVRVLVIDPVAVSRLWLCSVVRADAALAVAGACADADAAFVALADDVPDVVVVDLAAARVDALTFLKRLVAHGTPVVVTSTDRTARGDARAVGAVAVVVRGARAVDEDAAALRAAVLQAAHRSAATTATTATTASARSLRTSTVTPGSLIVIGASTGGPEAIGALLRGLVGQLPPVVIVQHMARSHTARFVDSVARASPVNVVEATDGQVLRKNQVTVAPGGAGLDFDGAGDAVRVRFVDVARPTTSIDTAFHAAARLRSVDVAGVVLTGMGADGADGLSALFAAGALTVAQDEESSAVFGMPRAAIERGAVRRVLSLSRIATALLLWAARGARRGDGST